MDYIVRLIDLPYSVGGMVSVDETGFANIYINARMSIEQQRKNLKHELKHLKDNDIYNDKDIRTVEHQPQLLPQITAQPSDPKKDLALLRRLGILDMPDPLLNLPTYGYEVF